MRTKSPRCGQALQWRIRRRRIWQWLELAQRMNKFNEKTTADGGKRGMFNDLRQTTFLGINSTAAHSAFQYLYFIEGPSSDALDLFDVPE